MKNCINVGQKNNCIIMKIREDANIEMVKNELKQKVIHLKKFLKEEKIPIQITGRVLKNKEIDMIEEIIKQHLDVDVDFDMPKELGLHNIKRAFTQEVSTSETKFHKGSLRSGQKIESDGSIVILGDVNAGAEVIASDNIIILGNLRGLAHAGAKGNTQAIIGAGRLDTVQIRISNIVKEFDRDEEVMHKQVCVFVNDNRIEIE